MGAHLNSSPKDYWKLVYCILIEHTEEIYLEKKKFVVMNVIFYHNELLYMLIPPFI